MRISERDTHLTPCQYSVAQFVEEIEYAGLLAPAQRGAMVAAAKKRMKASIVMRFLICMATEHDLDMTPTIALNCVREWLGRCAARKDIAAQFGLTGRSAAQKSTDHALAIELAGNYKKALLQEIETTFAKVEKVQRTSNSRGRGALP